MMILFILPLQEHSKIQNNTPWWGVIDDSSHIPSQNPLGLIIEIITIYTHANQQVPTK